MTVGQLLFALLFGAAGIAFLVYANQKKESPEARAFAIFLGLVALGLAVIALMVVLPR